MMSFEERLLALACAYRNAVSEAGSGKSLSRVATIVANRGSFFSALEGGATCSVRNFDKFVTYFAKAANWPAEEIPAQAYALLHSFGVRSGSSALVEVDIRKPTGA